MCAHCSMQRCGSVIGWQVLDKEACESALNGTEEWHMRQQQLAQDIIGGADRPDVVQKAAAPAAAAPRPFVVQSPPLRLVIFVTLCQVHSRFRPWTFKNKAKK
jgi:hypothetical protein